MSNARNTRATLFRAWQRFTEGSLKRETRGRTMAETSTPPVSYRVRVLPAQHELQVEMTLDLPLNETELRLEVPTWVPGDYEFMQFGRDLFDITGEDVLSGARLRVLREGWQGYRVKGVQGALRISYKAYAFATEFAETCGIVDSEYAMLLGTRYLQTPAWTGPCRVSYELPAGWKIHHPAGATRVGHAPVWDYPSYEILLDSPVVMGNYDLQTRKVKGTSFYYVFLDRAVGYDSNVDNFVDGLKAVAEECHRIFDSFPFTDYTFLITFNPSSDWGLEHLTSSTCGVGAEVFIDQGQAAFGARVCAHELFHAWNVRRLRPAPLKRLDLQHGSFTEDLWMAEGFTRYYEFLICTRTGFYTPDQFFSTIVNYFTHLTAVPARARVTAVDSSLATYLNHGKYPGRSNNSIDYYDAGMLVAFDLDVELRLGTPADSLDLAFREFYEKFVSSCSGYTTEDAINFFEDRRPGLGAMLRHEVEQPFGRSVVSLLKKLGFRVDFETGHFLGLILNNDTGPTIANVLDTSSAGQSGIAPGDVLTRVNGFPCGVKSLKWLAGRQEAVTLEVMRGQRTLTFTIRPAGREQIVRLVWEGSEAQANLIRRWLRHPDFHPQQAQSIALDFYENFHGIETVI